MPHRYTKEQRDFIQEVSPGRYNDEIVAMFNEKFGTSITEGQIKSYKGNHKLKSNVPKRRMKEDEGLFSKEQQEFIKNNVEGINNQLLADLINEKFDMSITRQQMKTWKNNHGLSSGLKGSEGISPPNKGTKGKYGVGGNKTSFKKGQKAHNYLPIGTERIDRDGYVLIKVSDEGSWNKRWRHKHKVVWEKENGPIPRGYVLVFLDRNKQNIKLDNLQLVSQAELVRANQKGLLYEDSDLTKTGLLIAKVYNSMGERKKKRK